MDEKDDDTMEEWREKDDLDWLFELIEIVKEEGNTLVSQLNKSLWKQI